VLYPSLILPVGENSEAHEAYMLSLITGTPFWRNIDATMAQRNATCRAYLNPFTFDVTMAEEEDPEQTCTGMNDDVRVLRSCGSGLAGLWACSNQYILGRWTVAAEFRRHATLPESIQPSNKPASNSPRMSSRQGKSGFFGGLYNA